jgi:hypothetical protein
VSAEAKRSDAALKQAELQFLQLLACHLGFRASW